MLNRDTSETALFAKTIHLATGTVHSSTFAEPISDYSIYCTQGDQIQRIAKLKYHDFMNPVIKRLGLRNRETYCSQDENPHILICPV